MGAVTTAELLDRIAVVLSGRFGPVSEEVHRVIDAMLDEILREPKR